MPSWSDIKRTWSSGWAALEAKALKLYGAAIRADPTGYAAKVTGFAFELEQSRANLDRMRAKLPGQPATDADRQLVANYQAMEARYNDLAAGFYSDVKPVSEGVGVVPVLVVGGLLVGVAAIAWAVAAYEYAVNLREQTALAAQELDARVDASKEGRALPPSTLPPPPPPPVPPGTGSAVGWLLVGGLVLAAGAVALPVLLAKKG
jgi:hypothetical protein